ncbi:PQQ-binding-like beta-propeller repeat protein [Rosistilla oblonga]|uniref:PQQ-like beta-propeller repeat protein n=1 Tax=Rosistilla oblonga TaxID=2527990 RepID=UPI003A96A1D3
MFDLLARCSLCLLILIPGCDAADPVPVADSVGSQALSTASWPCWMGPRHDGISTEANWSADWPDEGLPIVWTQQLGIGFSSISIADGRLFSMGHVDGEEFVYCLDAATGKTLWTHRYACELVDNLYEGGPGSTPTIDGDLVYTLGKQGQLFCFRAADGEILWQKDLQVDLEIPMPEWGFNSSARVVDDAVVFEAGRVVSYHKLTGEKNWQSEPHRAGYGSVARFAGERSGLLATLDCDAVRITAATDGSEIASFPWKSPFGTNSTTPILAGDKIFISTGYQVGCGLFQLQEDGLDLIYENRSMRNHFNNCILYDGYLYGIDGNSNLGRVVHLVCMNLETGEVAWRERGFGCGSLMIADGKLVILADDGRLVLAEANPEEYRQLASSPFLEGRCWTVPVLAGGHIYGRNAAGKIVCARLPAKSAATSAGS